MFRTWRTLPASLLAICLSLVASKASVADDAPRSTAEATREVLSAVPNDMAGFIIFQDLSESLDRFLASEVPAKLNSLEFVKRWKDSSEFQIANESVRSFPAYFGVDLPTLRRDIVGQSLVLAFRPGDRPGINDVGLMICRARKKESLDRVVETLLQPIPGRTIEKRQYLAIDYYVRTEGGNRTDYLLQLGSMGALSDKEEAIKGVIEAKTKRKGILSDHVFKSMYDGMPSHALCLFLVKPRAFDSQVESATRSAPILGGLAWQFWKSLKWTGFSVATGEALHLGWHYSLDEDSLPAGLKKTIELIYEPTPFFDSIDQDCLAAVTTRIDFAELKSMLVAAANPDQKRSIVHMLTFVDQLIPSSLVNGNWLSGIGPNVGVQVVLPAKGIFPVLVGEIQLKDVSTPISDSKNDLSIVESIARPVLALVGVQQSERTGKEFFIRSQFLANGPVLYLSFSKDEDAKEILAPSLAIRKNRIIIASSPQAIQMHEETSARPLSQHPVWERLRKDLGSDYVGKGYVNLKKLRELLVQYQPILDALPKKKAGTQDIGLGDTLELLGLCESATLGHSRKKSSGDAVSHHWTLSFVPAKSSASK